MESQYKMNGNQYDFEKDAAAVLYKDGKLKPVLDELTSLKVSEFGKKLLTADEAEFKRLLNISSENFWDECQNRWGTSNGAKTSTAQKKFGAKSLGCTSEKSVFSSDYLVFGGDPFTINFWFYYPAVVYDKYLFRALGTSRSFGLYWGPSGGNVDVIYFYTGTTSLTTASAGTTTKPNTSKWNHIEIGYNSGKLYCFLNGNNFFSIFPASITVPREPRRIYFGPFNAYIDEFRIRDGTCAHTANFSVPASAYGKTADTIALLHFND